MRGRGRKGWRFGIAGVIASGTLHLYVWWPRGPRRLSPPPDPSATVASVTWVLLLALPVLLGVLALSGRPALYAVAGIDVPRWESPPPGVAVLRIAALAATLAAIAVGAGLAREKPEGRAA